MSTSRSRFFFSFIVCLALPTWCAAQQRINGTVTKKETREPLASATVRVEGDALVAAVETRTDAAGRFSVSGLSPSRYVVSVSAGNFYAQQVALTLSPRETQQLDFELVPLANVSEQVTVRAQNHLLDGTEAATIRTIDVQELDALPAARRTQLTDAVTPFVSSAVAGHDNLVHLRGNELSLNTFINGVSFFDNPHQLFTPGLSADVVQSMNVITGGFPAEFGNRFGGILDIVTRSGFDARGHGSATIGAGTRLRDNLAFNYGDHTKRFGYFFYAQGFESERFLNTPEQSLLHDRGYGARTFAQLDFRATPRDSFKLLLTGDGTNFELPNTTEDELRRRDFSQRNREQTAIISWDHAFSQSSLLSTSLYERFVSARLVPTSDAVSIEAGGART
jgi:hypothetical protein